MCVVCVYVSVCMYVSRVCVYMSVHVCIMSVYIHMSGIIKHLPYIQCSGNFFLILVTIPNQWPLPANNGITRSSSYIKYINNSLQYLLCKCFVVVNSVIVYCICLKPLNYCVNFIEKMLQIGGFSLCLTMFFSN